jgi:hypothetical protein
MRLHAGGKVEGILPNPADGIGRHKHMQAFCGVSRGHCSSRQYATKAQGLHS